MITLMLVLSFVLAVMLSSVVECSRKKISTETCKPLVEKYSAEYNVPEYIIFAVIDVESDFDPMATSSANACGLMQMTPKTFAWLTSSEHLGENLTSLDLYDPEINIRYGTYYLRYLFTRFHNWDTALAAYNAGEGNVSEWLEDSEYSDGDGTLKYIPFKETRNYVKKVNKSIEDYKKIYYRNEEN
jgi:soluble lytic murein transglycosylase